MADTKDGAASVNTNGHSPPPNPFWSAGVRLVQILQWVWSTVVRYQSPFLYVRLLLWLCTLGISFLPFIGAQTQFFAHWEFTFSDMYRNHYEGILAVFIVTIAVAMFDVLGILILLMGSQSYIALPATMIFGSLTILYLMVGLALGGAIQPHAFGQTMPHPPQMHGAILALSALMCLTATVFVAILSDEYQYRPEPQKRQSQKRSPSRK